MIENETDKIIWNILVIIFMVGCTSLLIDWKKLYQKFFEKQLKKA